MANEQEQQNQQSNQQAETARQAKKLAKQTMGAKGFTESMDQVTQSVEDVAQGLGKGVVGVTKVAGDTLQAPGAVVEGVGGKVGDALNTPGKVVQKVSNKENEIRQKMGDFLNKPGDNVIEAGVKNGETIKKNTEILGDKVENVLGEGAGDFVKGAGQAMAGAEKLSAKAAGEVLKAPGNLIKGVSHVGNAINQGVGEVLKVPGTLVKETSKLAGKVLKAPGEMVKGLAQGVDNVLFNKDKSQQFSNIAKGGLAAGTMKGLYDKAKEVNVFDELKNDKQYIDGNKLQAFDKFSEKMDKLANGKVTEKEPFSKILTMDPSKRQDEAIKQVDKLQKDMSKVREDLEKHPEKFSIKDRKELTDLFEKMEQKDPMGMEKAIVEISGADKGNVSQHKDQGKTGHDFGAVGPEADTRSDKGKAKESQGAEKDNPLEDMVDKAKEKTSDAKEELGKSMDQVKEKSKASREKAMEKITGGKADKDVKPIISGTSVPGNSMPSRGAASIGDR